jgi:two-component sensor histidine kinase
MEVNMQDYLKGVLDFYSNILESKPKVVLKTNIPSVSFHTKLAMPLAIVLNELITNSLKYAFPNDEGEINVGLIYNKESDFWDFSVKDNGIGFSNNTESFKQSSLGLTLVRLMAQQIDGELIVQSDQQMAVVIRFKNRG